MSEFQDEQQSVLLKNTWLDLLLISFAALFFEILVIRWIASEIRIFAYMKNLTLMAAVLGLGLGCSGAAGDNLAKSRNPILIFTALFALLALVLALAPSIGLTDMTFVLGAEVYNWQFTVSSLQGLFTNVICLLSVFLLLVAIFDFLGQELGKQITRLPALKAYAVNLAGSLLGVIVFSLMSFLSSPPTIWTALGLASLFRFCRTKAQAVFFAVLSVGIISLAQLSVGNSLWTPYYRIDLSSLQHWYRDGVEVIEPFELGKILQVNHMMHQAPFNFSREFFEQHPQLWGSSDYLTYNLPYTVKESLDKVLVLGAGTGNDLALCLQHNPRSVDAVEIDPGILKLGREIHPQKPYSDARVHAYVDDARAFLAANQNKYDLIVFAYLDSQTALSTLSSLRLDNYLYTKEALLIADRHLSKDGIASLSFSAQPIWLQARLYQMAKSVYGKEPVLIRTGFHGKGSLAILWGPGLDAARENLKKRYGSRFIDAKQLAEPVAIPSDNWPFLYQRAPGVPVVYLAILSSVILISSWLVFRRFRLSFSTLKEQGQFFFLGAAFLLLETLGMLSVASLFGSTWIVNSIVIGILLLTAMLSNFLVSKYQKILSERLAYACLALALLINFLIPLSSFASCPVWLRALISLFLIGSPFLFSGMIFSKAFACSRRTELALGVNILGAILGACLEYLSTALGCSALLLLAAFIYALSFLMANRKESAVVS
ncbi:MAG: hypothetical protein K2X27_08200 [Candidatus Obscuribacterales bacterium]|nr:hypothetical protein [Candidatus Obscuribacterales bacterium]